MTQLTIEILQEIGDKIDPSEPNWSGVLGHQESVTRRTDKRYGQIVVWKKLTQLFSRCFPKKKPEKKIRDVFLLRCSFDSHWLLPNCFLRFLKSRILNHFYHLLFTICSSLSIISIIFITLNRQQWQLHNNNNNKIISYIVSHTFKQINTKNNGATNKTIVFLFQ